MALNHYRLLGIPPDADQQRIKAAYRSLAKRFHPDANQGSEAAAELFRQINEAYRVLADTGARRQYDRKLKAEQQSSRAAQPPPANTSPPGEAEDKFNRFLNSLLDALFAPLEQPPPPGTATRAPPKQPLTTKKRNSPAFSFYFHLALEKQEAPYEQGRDGIYRSPPKARKAPGPGRPFGRATRGTVVTVLLTTLLSLLNL